MSIPKKTTESKPNGGWFRLPNMLVDHLADLGPLAVTVFVVLARHADEHGKCWPSIPRIAGLCGCTDRSVQMAIRRLAEIGLVTVTPVRNERGQTSNVYTLPPINPVKPDAPGGATECTGGVKQVSPGGRNRFHPEGRPNEQDPRNETQGKKTSPNKFGDDDLALASFMVEVVSRIQKPAKEPNVENWADTIRLMRERDGRTIDQIRELFTWANNHHFWKSNIRSPEKLREQWDRLTIQKQENNGHASTSKRAPLQTRGLRYDPAAPIADHL